MLRSFFGPSDQVTPKASPQANPFDLLGSKTRSPAASRKNSLQHLGSATTPTTSRFDQGSLLPTSPGGVRTPGPIQANGNYTHAPATTSLSRGEPNFDFKVNPAELAKNKAALAPQSGSPALSTGSNGSGQSNAGSASVQRGLLMLTLVSARNLAAPSSTSKPYVVATFDQSDFVSRCPIAESEAAVRGVAAPRPRLGTSPGRQASAKNIGATISRPSTPVRSTSASRFDDKKPSSAYDPVWKHEVVFDVVNDDHQLQLAIYDHAPDRDEDPFLGVVSLRPRLSHGQASDIWLGLHGRDDMEEVSGEIRIQYSYERFDGKRSLTVKDFDFLRMIGKGTFGRVFQVRKKDTKRIYAMKVLSKREIIAKKEVAHTIGERKILQRGSECPFLLGLKFSFQSTNDLYLVMDYKSGGELFHHLQREGRFVEERARFYTAEIVLAFEHLHKYDIVYRDLKPENILLDATGHIVLCDFGLSKPDLPSDALTTTFCGTTEYLAPEVLLDDNGYSKLVDFWSLGVLLFEMCCGWSPFYAEDTQQMYKNICFGKIKFPKGIIGDDGKQFVKALLNRNPKHRLGAQRDAAELKEHPFFSMIDWTILAAREVTPPFKPFVESDESVANFDAEFTDANLADEAPQDLFDEDDPSDRWIDQVATSQRRGSGPLAIRPPPRKQGNHRGSPLSSSVQEAFSGFSFVGDSHLDDLDDASIHRFRQQYGGQ